MTVALGHGPRVRPRRRASPATSRRSSWPTQQPMKMAAAEALWDDRAAGARFSIFTIGDARTAARSIFYDPDPVPALVPRHRHLRTARSRASTTSRPSTGRLLRPRRLHRPSCWVTYWSFRCMIGAGMLAALTAVVGLLLATRQGRTRRLVLRLVPSAIALPSCPRRNSIGWIFTEMGRQPWVVFGLMLTATAVSPVGRRPGASLITADRVHASIYGGPRRRRRLGLLAESATRPARRPDRTRAPSRAPSRRS